MRWQLIAIAGLVACVDHGPGPDLQKVPAGYVSKHRLAALPPGVQPVRVSLGDGALEYVGNVVDRPRVAPGETVTVTHYWRVVKPVGPQWRVFAIVRGAAGSADFINLDATDMQRAYGPGRWQAGEIIEDVQTFTIRPDWKSPTATLAVGLIKVGAHGTLDRMAASGERVSDRAVVATTLEIDVSRAPPLPGTVHIPRATGPIVIDGMKTEPGWGKAAVSPDFVAGDGSGEPAGKATARMVWDDTNLYVFAQITDTDVFSPYKEHDDSLWKADCIEMFIDADSNKRGYIELQVNPNNATFDSWFPGGREKGIPAWTSHMVTAVKVNGTPDRSDGSDIGWDVEMAIPWAAIRGDDPTMVVTLPPAVGDRWRLNLVRVDKRAAADVVTVSSWNRIGIGDFHALDRMLTAVFADPQGSTRTVPPVAPVTPVLESSGVGVGPGAGPGPGAGTP